MNRQDDDCGLFPRPKELDINSLSLAQLPQALLRAVAAAQQRGEVTEIIIENTVVAKIFPAGG